MAFFKRKNELAPVRAPSVEERAVVWQAEQDRLAELVESARDFRGLTAAEIDRTPIALKPGEHVYLIGQGARLIEPRSTGGHWQSGSRGVSVRIPGTKSARYRFGATKGSYVRGEDKPTPIDEGTVVITDRRVAFAGAKQTREWLWSKCVGMQHQPDAAWTAIAVSNRQKTSGILYGDELADTVQFRLDLAFAVATGEADDFVADLERQLAEHTKLKPGSALPPPPG